MTPALHRQARTDHADAPRRFGLAWNHSAPARLPADLRRLYAEIVELVEHAEDRGLDSFWLAQHHFDDTPCPVPSPLPLLAVAATRTARIALGTGITVLPLEDPIRLAEDAGVVDVLAGGRLELGLATGGNAVEAFRAFGLRAADRQAIYEAKRDRLHDVLGGAELAAGEDGGPGPSLVPGDTGLRRRLWQAVTSVDHAVAAARAGDGIQVGTLTDPVVTGQLPKVEAYLAEWSRLGRDDQPRVAVFRFVYLGETRAEVRRRALPRLGGIAEVAARVAASRGATAFPGTSGFTAADYLDSVPVYGAPADVAAALDRDPVARLATDLVANFNYFQDFDAEETRAHLDLLVDAVIPALDGGALRSAPTTPTSPSQSRPA